MPVELIVTSYQLTDIGQERQQNRDYVGYREPDQPDEKTALGRLYLVADGADGAAAGDVASKYVVDKVLDNFYNSIEPDPDRRLLAAVEAANTAIFTNNQQHRELPEMATTLVAALIHGEKLSVANIGDSRAYLVRDQQIDQISQDHSLVAQLVRAGSITPAEAEDHPDRGQLTRTIGVEERATVDQFSRPLHPGDVVVLCTDGLTRYITDPEIAQAVSQYEPEAAVHHLVDLANTRGGEDNISVSATYISSELPPEPQALGRIRPRLPIPYAIALAVLFAVVIAGGLFILFRNSPADLATTSPQSSSTSTGVATPTSDASARAEAVAQQRRPTGTMTPTQTSEPSPTPTATSTATATNPPPSPSPTPAPTESPTVQPSPLPSEPPSDCTNLAQYLNEDLFTVDGAVLTPGQIFAKGWLLKNEGTCPWNGGYTFRPLRPGPLGEEPVPLTELLPKATIPLSVTMTAPEEEGTYISCWQIHTPNGRPFGPRLYGEVVVDDPSGENPAQASALFNVVEESITEPWATEFQIPVLLNSDTLFITLESASPPAEPIPVEITFSRTNGPSAQRRETAIVSEPVSLPFSQTFPLTAIYNCVGGTLTVQITPPITSTLAEPLRLEVQLRGQ